ncbi:hypothetical protein BS47DRAFT_1000952 [Hydnum rufescens UP504]|uniref:Uncharacterized protein n=1 Tax=Hydnum rufescens UP504 TaxID=1448309 RepID=A0A9P6DYT9_9AGAM|nr:hypothetical protein BS47DRAFT_1000952 [Hydnum rufescens UP504]
MPVPHQFAPRPGCPLCSIVAAPLPPRSDRLLLPGGPRSPWRRDSDNTSLSSSTGPSSPSPDSASSQDSVILYRDANVTAYLEKKYPVSSKGHIIIVLNLHVPSIYTLSSNDIPLLNHIQSLAFRLLKSLNPPAPMSPSPFASQETLSSNQVPLQGQEPPMHVGFITPPFRDSKIPITDHLHAHAYLGAPDLAGWWRGTAYGSLAWYSVQDLIAEIRCVLLASQMTLPVTYNSVVRESTSNNRVKSGYTNRATAPIDLVPGAGALSGNADGTQAPPAALPFQVNKAHISPVSSPTPNVMVSKPSEDTAASSSSVGKSPARAEFEAVISGSVDLGSGHAAVSHILPRLGTSSPTRGRGRYRENENVGGLEDAEWDDTVVAGRFEGEAGPSTVRTLKGVTS